MDANSGIEKVRFESETFSVFGFYEIFRAAKSGRLGCYFGTRQVKASLRQVEIRDGMAELELAAKEYSKFAASLQQTLKRLVRKGEVEVDHSEQRRGVTNLI